MPRLWRIYLPGATPLAASFLGRLGALSRHLKVYAALFIQLRRFFQIQIGQWDLPLPLIRENDKHLAENRVVFHFLDALIPKHQNRCQLRRR